MSEATSGVLAIPAYRCAHAGYLLSQKLSCLIPGVQSSTVTAIPVIAGPV